MEKGGNAKLKEFFQRYDLNDEAQNVKFSTVAANYYKKWLLSMVQGTEFTEQAPLYDDGRKQFEMDFDVQEGAEEGADEDQEYDPSDPDKQLSRPDDMEQMKKKASDALKSGVSYLYWGASKVK